MHNYTREDILRLVEEEDVAFIRLQFTDIFGTMKNMAVTVSQLEKALDNRCMFDVSSLDGLSGEEDSDMYLYPDLSTFEICPWRPQQGIVARLICDVYRTDGTPYEVDPRYVLKKAIAHAAELGYTLNAGPECEFFLFHTDDDGQATVLTHEKAGYLDANPRDLGESARREMVQALEEMGVEVEASRHEISPGQHGIDLRQMRLMEAADGIMTFQTIVRSVAKRHGLHATFMPKPLGDAEGSGIHLHFMLYKNGKNIFAGTENGTFSREAVWFAGGLLEHMKGITAVANPLINSYKRLVAGTKAPTEISWSSRRENSLIRIPPVRGRRTRVEYRGADGSSNPYLLLALCLEAGFSGIQNQTQIPEGKSMGRLPGNLGEALDYMAEDLFVRDVLGQDLFRRYMECREEEWDNYSRQVTEWELQNYLCRY